MYSNFRYYIRQKKKLHTKEAFDTRVTLICVDSCFSLKKRQFHLVWGKKKFYFRLLFASLLPNYKLVFDIINIIRNDNPICSNQIIKYSLMSFWIHFSNIWPFLNDSLSMYNDHNRCEQTINNRNESIWLAWKWTLTSLFINVANCTIILMKAITCFVI